MYRNQFIVLKNRVVVPKYTNVLGFIVNKITYAHTWPKAKASATVQTPSIVSIAQPTKVAETNTLFGISFCLSINGNPNLNF